MSFLGASNEIAGEGNSNVFLSIPKAKVRQGSMVSGTIRIAGGEAGQDVKAIYLSVLTSVLVEGTERKSLQDMEIQQFQVSRAFAVAPQEEKAVPFSFVLSPETPITLHKLDVWVEATVDFGRISEVKKEIDLHVIGTEAVESILTAVKELDFPIKKVVNVESRKTGCGVIQEFEFYTNRRYKRRFSEMELVFISDSEKTTAYIRLDREERTTKELLARQMDGQESRLSFQYRHGEVPAVEEIMEQLQNFLKTKPEKS